jgi:uncharacterized protein (DUF488 family)
VPPRLLTVGHSVHSIADFAALLAAHDIDHLVDVRRRPASRRHPQFNRAALAASLAAADIGYTWLEVLGGMREPRPGTPNTALGDLAGYADHMATAAFAAGVETLAELATRHIAAVMCAEADPAHCHRSLLSDYLATRGWDVQHVRTPTTLVPHAVSPLARVADDTLVYDRGQRSMF